MRHLIRNVIPRPSSLPPRNSLISSPPKILRSPMQSPPDSHGKGLPTPSPSRTTSKLHVKPTCSATKCSPLACIQQWPQPFSHPTAPVICTTTFDPVLDSFYLLYRFKKGMPLSALFANNTNLLYRGPPPILDTASQRSRYRSSVPTGQGFFPPINTPATTKS